jgi:hypothetical protein
MPIIPNIPNTARGQSKSCNKCKRSLPRSFFSKTHNFFYPDGYLPVCNDCIAEEIDAHECNWEYIDKLCMWAGIPFVVKEWDRIKEMTLPSETWSTYAKVFADQEY